MYLGAHGNIALGVACVAFLSTAESPNQGWKGSFSADSQTDGQDFVIDDVAGGGWFVFGDATNGVPDSNLRVLLMQVTTAGSISGTFNVQIFPLGDGDNEVRKTFHFDGLGLFIDSSLPNCGCLRVPKPFESWWA